MKKIFLMALIVAFSTPFAPNLAHAKTPSSVNLMPQKGEMQAYDPAEGTKADRIEDQQRAEKAKHHKKHAKSTWHHHKRKTQVESPAAKK